MSWSLLNNVMAEKVEALLNDEHIRQSLEDGQRALPREEALAVIHAALWAYSSRKGSTASAYAMTNMYEALGLETWTFKEP